VDKSPGRNRKPIEGKEEPETRNSNSAALDFFGVKPLDGGEVSFQLPVDVAALAAALFLVKYFLFHLTVCDGMPNMIAEQTCLKKWELKFRKI